MHEALGVERRRRRSTPSRPRALAIVPFAFLAGSFVAAAPPLPR
jgi:hypothetical protein